MKSYVEEEVSYGMKGKGRGSKMEGNEREEKEAGSRAKRMIRVVCVPVGGCGKTS